MKATVANLRRAVESLGGTLDENREGRYARFNCEAPIGKVWSCTGDLHMLVVEWEQGDRTGWRETALSDGLERVAMGLTDCDDPDCDYCHNEVDQ